METAKKRILVVENDPDILEATRMVLERIGHHEVVTSCLSELDHKLAQELPDLILLDGGSHQMNTTDICKTLKGQENTKGLPLLLFSTRMDIEKLSKEAGADDFLTKPFDFHKLLEKIERLTTTKS